MLIEIFIYSLFFESMSSLFKGMRRVGDRDREGLLVPPLIHNLLNPPLSCSDAALVAY